MTNKVVTGSNTQNSWIQFEKDDKSGCELEVYGDKNGVDITVYGHSYKDRDNYRVTPYEAFVLDLEETKTLRDYLNAAIEECEKHVE